MIELSKHRADRSIAPLGVLAALLLLSACSKSGSEPGQPPYSGLLVTIDTTRADALTVYGNRPEVTPGLQEFSKESLVYERAHTVTALTLPAHTSMMTGLYPPRHTVRDNGIWALPESADTLAERAKQHGFQTAAFLAAVVLHKSFGLGQGFDTYVTPEKALASGTTYYSERPADAVVDDAIQWLGKRAQDEHFFLWVHLFDPHGPHEAPEGFRHGILAKNPYFGEISFADHELSRLFKYMDSKGLMDSTYVAVVADHGEAFGEHGEWSHGGYCYEATMRVPLLLRDPSGYRAGERSRETVSVVDLEPTLGEAMGIEPSKTIDGISLFRKKVEDNRGIYVESYMGYLSWGWSPLAGWIQGDRKYLHSSEPELFDLAQDAAESRNLYSVRPDEVKQYQREIALLYQKDVLKSGADTSASAMLDEIRGLGYVSMGSATEELPNPLAPCDLPSPASMIEAHRKTMTAMNLNNTGRVDEAEAVFRELLEDDPNNHFARHLLAFCLMKQNRKAEAIPLLENVTKNGPPWPDAFSNLGLCLAEVGRYDEAEAAFARALQLDPNKRKALWGLVRILDLTGRSDEGEIMRKRLEEIKKGL